MYWPSACREELDASVCALFPRAPQPGERGRYHRADLYGPLLRLPRKPPLCMPEWERGFAHDLVRWARAPTWPKGPSDVSLAELALEYEAFMGRALPVFPYHKLRGTRLVLGEQA